MPQDLDNSVISFEKKFTPLPKMFKILDDHNNIASLILPFTLLLVLTSLILLAMRLAGHFSDAKDFFANAIGPIILTFFLFSFSLFIPSVYVFCSYIKKTNALAEERKNASSEITKMTELIKKIGSSKQKITMEIAPVFLTKNEHEFPHTLSEVIYYAKKTLAHLGTICRNSLNKGYCFAANTDILRIGNILTDIESSLSLIVEYTSENHKFSLAKLDEHKIELLRQELNKFRSTVESILNIISRLDSPIITESDKNMKNINEKLEAFFKDLERDLPIIKNEDEVSDNEKKSVSLFYDWNSITQQDYSNPEDYSNQMMIKLRECTASLIDKINSCMKSVIEIKTKRDGKFGSNPGITLLDVEPNADHDSLLAATFGTNNTKECHHFVEALYSVSTTLKQILPSLDSIYSLFEKNHITMNESEFNSIENAINNITQLFDNLQNPPPLNANGSKEGSREGRALLKSILDDMQTGMLSITSSINKLDITKYFDPAQAIKDELLTIMQDINLQKRIFDGKINKANSILSKVTKDDSPSLKISSEATASSAIKPENSQKKC